MCDKVEKFASWCAKRHRRCLFKGLSNVQSAQINKFERGLDFLPVLCTESSATQPDNVQAENGVALRCDNERRQILPKRRAALHHNQTSDVHELVKRRSTAEKHAVVDADVPGQQTVVSDDDVVSDDAIVPDVRSRHQEILIA